MKHSRRRNPLLGHVGAHAEDGLLEACPLLGGTALQFHLGLHFRVNWIGSAIFGSVSISPQSLQKVKSFLPSTLADDRPVQS